MKMKGCLGPVLLILAVVGIVILAGCASWDQAAAEKLHAQAAVLDARASMEHQREADAMDRYALHTATLAAFLSDDDSTLLLVLVALVAGGSLALLVVSVGLRRE